MLYFGASNVVLDSHMLLELGSSLLCLLPQRPYSRCICHTSHLETAQPHVPAGGSVVTAVAPSAAQRLRQLRVQCVEGRQLVHRAG